MDMDDAMAVLDADIRYTRRRLAKARDKANAAAKIAGQRRLGADSYCEWVEYVLGAKLAARDTIAALATTGEGECVPALDVFRIAGGDVARVVKESNRDAGGRSDVEVC